MQVNVYSSQPSDRSDGLDGAGNDALFATGAIVGSIQINGKAQTPLQPEG